MFLPLNTTLDVQNPDVAILPVGSHEQHGPILPLATDTIIASTVARALSSTYPVLELPPITISCSHEHAAWPGTVSITAPTLYAVVRDIAHSLHKSGIPKLVLVNGHGGNYVLANLVQESTGMALYPTEADWHKARTAGGIETPMVSDMHAGELEVSILLHAHPEVVREDYAEHDHLADNRDHMLTLGLGPYTKSGVIGRPSKATREKGSKVLDSLVKTFANVLKALD
ncbi:creatininase family protein [Kibdelosporangium phytohabitans]|uniref:Creatinine amidohydrolase n=1 Tax=Kibdelosporangium phytohabitans TaxID=860235 RepID=A0A0N7F4F4_9PSEU|nr:creatininase family protein [Kibdelosporangium phytohabitans]ALG11279.1 creatinine amidohydrolase [Kibdelosporangium phytohabitans]MBE1462569.1 creatinine amidohydrolase [Kibdelosporangium phytohabitans]